MVAAVVVFSYLAIVLYVGIFAFRRGGKSGEDYFLASRSLGTWVFLLALFGTNMTAFSILGASGLAYQRGIGVFGMLASASALIIPLSFFFVGTRLWALGKRFGFMTQVQFFRDRWECSGIGTVIFALMAAMLIPYIVIGVMGGGRTLEALTGGFVPYWLGGGVVALVVMSYVFFGGMRGTAWVNVLQTSMFLCFGVVAFAVIGKGIGGFGEAMERLAQSPATAPLLARARIPTEEFFSYSLIPLSSIMFPHVAIMCLTARRAASFKHTVVFYPLCILALWLPSVFLGVVGAGQVPGLKTGEADEVLMRLLNLHAAPWLAGMLGAAIMAAVMASDSQILALGTMFTEDIFAYYGGKDRFGEQAQVWTGRAFVVGLTILAYAAALALKEKEGIFDLAIRFAFSGYAAMAPVMLAALFWRRSTQWGALAATLWVAANLIGVWLLYSYSAGIAPQPGQPPVAVFPALGGLFLRTPGNVTLFGYLPVVPMVAGSLVLMVLVSLLTRPPSRATLQRYFNYEPDQRHP
jgi:SSS family solute:Na+ symporter